MQFIFGLIAIYLFVVYVLPLMFSIFAGICGLVAVFAAFMGIFCACRNYITAIKNNINLHEWSWPQSDEPAVRSYFFGPGFQQLKNTVKEAFQLNGKSSEDIRLKGETFRVDKEWYMKLWSYIYVLVGCVGIGIAGTLLSLAMGLVHGGITFAFMLIIFVLFSIVWMADRIYLFANKIRSDCPVCHTRYLIPAFACPVCGRIHKQLIPGTYGILNHTCECGSKLPCTFFNGRSQLEAMCPECEGKIVSSNARPIAIQLLGGTGSGKTVYLTAFYHEFLKKLRSNNELTYSIAEGYEPYFSQMEEWYRGGDCPATAQLNSQMYPILIGNDKFKVDRQFYIYDIAGEMFNGYSAENELVQKQFQYCDGLLFVIDPFSAGDLRSRRVENDEDLSGFSEMDIDEVVTNFDNYLINTGNKKVGDRFDIPLSVLVVKSDVREVKSVIGPAKMKQLAKSNPDCPYDELRDEHVKDFLREIGFSSAVEQLDSRFTKVHYFPVSSIGHAVDGDAYDPWGVWEPVEWILSNADKELSDIIAPRSDSSKPKK